jgi:hypothetical protein
MIRRLLARWANAAHLTALERLQREVADLQAELEARNRTIAVQQGELDNLAAVVARDRARIKAEGAAYSRRQAEAEGTTKDDQRPESSLGRFAS